MRSPRGPGYCGAAQMGVGCPDVLRRPVPGTPCCWCCCCEVRWLAGVSMKLPPPSDSRRCDLLAVRAALCGGGDAVAPAWAREVGP